MGDYKNNPEVPFEIWVPNKIRKRIAMHGERGLKVGEFIRSFVPPLLGTPTPKVRGSMWSRFTSRVANILSIKPDGVRK